MHSQERGMNDFLQKLRDKLGTTMVDFGDGMVVWTDGGTGPAVPGLVVGQPSYGWCVTSCNPHCKCYMTSLHSDQPNSGIGTPSFRLTVLDSWLKVDHDMV
jgi:hypothetical protein